MMAPSVYVPHLGPWLRVLRVARGLSLEELGAATDLSPATLGELEAAHMQGLAPESLRAIARALDVHVGQLFPRVAPPCALPEGVVAFARRMSAAERLDPEEVVWLAAAALKGRVPMTERDFARLHEALRASTAGTPG
jgi:transcriptional regulator with XRE-family HTH domain